MSLLHSLLHKAFVVRLGTLLNSIKQRSGGAVRNNLVCAVCDSQRPKKQRRLLKENPKANLWVTRPI